MDKQLRNTFAQLKSKCKIKTQRKAYNRLINSFGLDITEIRNKVEKSNGDGIYILLFNGGSADSYKIRVIKDGKIELIGEDFLKSNGSYPMVYFDGTISVFWKDIQKVLDKILSKYNLPIYYYNSGYSLMNKKLYNLNDSDLLNITQDYKVIDL